MNISEVLEQSLEKGIKENTLTWQHCLGPHYKNFMENVYKKIPAKVTTQLLLTENFYLEIEIEYNREEIRYDIFTPIYQINQLQPNYTYKSVQTEKEHIRIHEKVYNSQELEIIWRHIVLTILPKFFKNYEESFLKSFLGSSITKFYHIQNGFTE